MAAPKINLLQFLSDLDFPYMRAFMANPGLDARMGKMADAGDEAGLMRIVNKVMGREAPPVQAGRDPVPFEQRLANEPKIRAGLEEAGVPTAGMSQQDMLAEYTRQVMGAAAPRGRPRQAPPGQPPLGGMARARTPEDAIRELIPPPPPARQMELPFDEGPTGVIPYGVRGPGVPVGGVRGMGSLYNPGTEMIPAPLRGIPGQTRAMTPAVPRDRAVAEDIGRQFDAAIEGEILPAPREMVPVRRPDPVIVDESRPRFSGRDKVAAAALAGTLGGVAIDSLRDDLNSEPAALGDMPDTPMAVEAEDAPVDLTMGGEADLVEESRPAPKVVATKEPPRPSAPVAQPVDASVQARALIDRLNDMRRAAGGEVPEAPALMAEINRLLESGNQTRRATMVAAPGDDASRLFQQAQALIDQVNQMYRQGMTPNSPEVQRIMSEVRRLQAQGDAIRNRRAG